MILTKMVERGAIMTQYQQPYESIIKTLLEGSAAEMLPHLLPGRVTTIFAMFGPIRRVRCV